MEQTYAKLIQFRVSDIHGDGKGLLIMVLTACPDISDKRVPDLLATCRQEPRSGSLIVSQLEPGTRQFPDETAGLNAAMPVIEM